MMPNPTCGGNGSGFDYNPRPFSSFSLAVPHPIPSLRVSVAALRERFGPQRVAVVLGTSTSSIGASEEAYAQLEPDGRYPAHLRRPVVHTPHSLGDFVQHALGLEGPCATVATACSSSA